MPKDLDDHLQCQKSAKEKLEFYQDYLAVKGEKNLTMMTYLDKYPGLVHFIHVDRTTNQLTAPAINIDYSLDKKKSKTDAHRSLVCLGVFVGGGRGCETVFETSYIVWDLFQKAHVHFFFNETACRWRSI